MEVVVLKSNYLIVHSEDNRDVRWLIKGGYEDLGEDYYQILFTTFEQLVEEVKYLISNNAIFNDSVDEFSPYKMVEDLKADNYL